MFSLFIRMSLGLLVLNLLFAPADAYRGSSSRVDNFGKYVSSYREPGKPKNVVGTSSGIPSQNTSRRGLGLSAWGIVMLIVGIIMAGVGFYYFSICYPICSHPTNKYDKMSLPTMA